MRASAGRYARQHGWRDYLKLVLVNGISGPSLSTLLNYRVNEPVHTLDACPHYLTTHGANGRLGNSSEQIEESSVT